MMMDMIDVNSDEKFLEFCNYIQPIVNSCAGFIKTDGDFVHVMGNIILESADGCFLNVIDLPVSYNYRMTGKCNVLLSAKEEADKMNLVKNLEYYGSWSKSQEMLYLFNQYYNMISTGYSIVYSEDDAYNIPGFGEAVSSINYSMIPVVDWNQNMHMLSVSKSIIPLNKGDTCKVLIYDKRDGIYTTEYRVYKKKFKLYMSIYYNTIKL